MKEQRNSEYEPTLDERVCRLEMQVRYLHDIQMDTKEVLDGLKQSMDDLAHLIRTKF